MGGRRVSLTTSPPSVSRVGASTSHSSMGLHGLLQGHLYLPTPKPLKSPSYLYLEQILRKFRYFYLVLFDETYMQLFTSNILKKQKSVHRVALINTFRLCLKLNTSVRAGAPKTTFKTGLISRKVCVKLVTYRNYSNPGVFNIFSKTARKIYKI
jgi:hypothetical protein